jgi:hypothetical protein
MPVVIGIGEAHSTDETKVNARLSNVSLQDRGGKT